MAAKLNLHKENLALKRQNAALQTRVNQLEAVMPGFKLTGYEKDMVKSEKRKNEELKEEIKELRRKLFEKGIESEARRVALSDFVGEVLRGTDAIPPSVSDRVKKFVRGIFKRGRK